MVLVLLVGSFGPTAAQAKLPGGPVWLPPYGLGIDPGPMAVTLLLIGAMAIGMAGLLVGLRALNRGWRPDVRRLTRIGTALTVLMILVGPMGSTDVLIYAGYGRLAATGRSPYVDTVRELINSGDPIGLANGGIRWVDTTSVYGPITTWLQTLAAWIGNGSVHTTVFVMTALGAVAYLITGVLLRRLAGDDHLRQARVALLWTINPILLFIAVNSGHADTWGIVFAVAALVSLSRRHWILTGVLVAAACAVKITFGIYVLALVIVLRRLPKKLALVIVSGLLTGAICYLIVGPEAIRSTLLAGTKYASASPWRWPLYPLSDLIGLAPGVRVIVIVGWLSMLVFGWLFYRLLVPPGSRTVEGRPITAAVEESGDPLAAMLPVITALGIGWVLTSAYTLPWYDVVAWAPVALLLGGLTDQRADGARSTDPSGARLVDRVLVIRTGASVIGYLPGAAYYFPPAVQLLTDVARNVMAPAVSWALMILVVLAVLRRRRVGRQTGRP
ncbi:Protein of unknown function [Microlunatus soli]|uniref:Alpha-1,6-mannosyltransferase n=2 Tax=Microlunatus soli TaxID=630515 RepID=A0A1H1XZY9_9ACTN|nr:Protein of unknown function [Microlunatus soli]